MYIDWISALLLIGLGQGIFLSATLFIRGEKNRSANRFLAFYVLVMTLTLAEELIFYLELDIEYPTIALVLWPIVFLTGPSLIWYARNLLEQGFHFNRKQGLHLIPALISFCLMLPFYLLPESVKQPQLISTATATDFTWQIIGVTITFYFMMVHIGIYGVYIILYIRRYQRQRRLTFSHEEQALITWLYLLAALFACCWVLFLLSDFVTLFHDLFWLLMALTMPVLMYLITYFVIRQPLLFNEQEIVLPRSEDAPQTAVKKYYASSLTIDQARDIKNQLITLMETERPYLENKLTLQQLAAQLDVSPNHLSQVINDHLMLNFFDFVNRYRVNEAKRLLLTDQRRSVLDIALDAGFNSKSPFYKSFREHTGMTPLQFRKSAVNSA
ncbi:MAG: helix-turn-helix domain-containing protein [Chloroflexota bacterium]